MRPDGRMEKGVVASIRESAVNNAVASDLVVNLCDSHEIYRALCQEFVDAYANTSNRTEDATQAALFSLWLKIIGGPPPA